MEDKWTLLSQTVVKLARYGFNFKVNKPFQTKSDIVGYRRITLDIAILKKDGSVISAFYVGPIKQRRHLKYKTLKIPVFYIHREEHIDTEIQRFVEDYATRLF